MFWNKPVLDRLDKIADLQIQHTVQLARNTDTLENHHVRTSNIESRLKPIESHVTLMSQLFKLALALLTAAGTVFMILSRFK